MLCGGGESEGRSFGSGELHRNGWEIWVWNPYVRNHVPYPSGLSMSEAKESWNLADVDHPLPSVDSVRV